jgi:hypothetical protein
MLVLEHARLTLMIGKDRRKGQRLEMPQGIISPRESSSLYVRNTRRPCIPDPLDLLDKVSTSDLR